MVSATMAGVDTWSPAWYIDPEGRAGAWMSEFATAPGPMGAKLLSQKVGGHRVGWFPGGLLFAEGHPDPAGLCAPGELLGRALDLQDALIQTGLPLRIDRYARAEGLVSPADPRTSGPGEGFAGIRRLDATVNIEAGTRAEGLAVLAGIAACVRDSPGHAEVRFGLDRAVETVYLRGYSGRRVLGRWYDKGLESGQSSRGTLIRAEDQRRWGKSGRRDPAELNGETVRAMFRKRFYALYQLTKGVKVAGPTKLSEELLEMVERGEVTPREAESLAGHLMAKAVGGPGGFGISRATMYRRERRARELGLHGVDGVLDEVEVDVGQVLEAVLETDAWGRAG